MPDLQDLNAAPPDELRAQLLALTASPAWADALIARRPYRDLETLLGASDELVLGLPESEIDGALAGHPRIGESAVGLDAEAAARSAAEQAGMSQADDSVQAAMARGNAAYEERFGRIYLVAAAGRSAEDLVAHLYDRLDNAPGAELDVVRGELARITRLRLTGLLEPTGGAR